MYRTVIRPLLFQCDPESVHDLVLRYASSSIAGSVARFLYRYDSSLLQSQVQGKNFQNPIGLAAGVDKEGQAIDFFAGLGFSHVEVGTVTKKYQPGNPKPRVFRYPQYQALVNRLGFPSSGTEGLVPRLETARKNLKNCLIGVNIGKSKDTPLDEALEDYVEVFQSVKHLADYIAINVSSPNTPELRKLQEPQRLGQLFRSLQETNSMKLPLFVKVAPDLSWNELEGIVGLVLEYGLAGIIATNTTINREGTPDATEQGGLSGQPLVARSREIISFLYKQSKGAFSIIGVGGVFSAEDVIDRIQLGASLVQVYTGLIYQGPGMVQKMKRGVVQFMEREGARCLQDMIGSKTAIKPWVGAV